MTKLYQYLLDKIIPALLIGIAAGAINLYVKVQVLEVRLASLEKSYEDTLVQINDQVQRK